MNPKTALKRVSGVFLLMILVCIPQSACGRNAVAASRDSISISKVFGDLNLNQILGSAQEIINSLADKYSEGAGPIDLNLNLQFDFDIKSSNPFLLVQVIYNTLAGDDGMINELKDKNIEKFDEKTLKKLKKEFTKRSNKEIKKLCKGDRQTQKELKHKIKKLLDGIQIKK